MIIPFALKKLIPPGTNDPRIKARVMVFHVDASNSSSLYNYFDGPSGGIESHGDILKSGVLEQYRDTGFEADANYLANPFALSFESQGFGDGEWTDEQLDTIKRCIVWGHTNHAIPLHLPKTWDGDGVGYHTMYPQWSNVKGKTCPGPHRKEQFHDIIVPWMKDGAVVGGDPITPNIAAALQAADVQTRIDALKRVIKHGDSEASAAAKSWLGAIRGIEAAREDIKGFRKELRDLNVVRG